MKTFILLLEPHDDIVSARDKMKRVKSGRIILVWPEAGRLLNRRLDLLLLKRFSASLGAPLALVSKDPDIRYYAPRLGIPIFRSLQKAQNPHWRVSRTFRKSQFEKTLFATGDELDTDIPCKKSREEIERLRPEKSTNKLSTLARMLFFLLGVVALLSIAATLLPSAEVLLESKVQNQEITIDVQARPSVNSVNISGAVPINLKSVIVEGRDSAPVSGSITLPNKVATGYVTFTNMSDQKVTIPEGTIVRALEGFFEATPTANQSSVDNPLNGATEETISTDAFPLRFSVTQSQEIPAGPGNSITATVDCLVPGSAGNLPANSLIAIEGLLGTKLSVSNPEPTMFGSERTEVAPTQADRQKLASKLYEGLKETAFEEMQKDLKSGDLLIYPSMKLIRTVEETYLPADLEPADHLTLNQRLEFQASYVKGEDLLILAQKVLDANLPINFIADQESLEIAHQGKPVLDDENIARWKLHAQRKVQAKISESQTIQIALGMEPNQAQKLLSSYLTLGKPPQIYLFPSWWPRMPFIPFRIIIITS